MSQIQGGAKLRPSITAAGGSSDRDSSARGSLMAQLRSDSSKKALRPSMTQTAHDTVENEVTRSGDVTRVTQRERLKVAGAVALPLRHDSSKSVRPSADEVVRESMGGDELLSAITNARRSLRPSVAPMADKAAAGSGARKRARSRGEA